MNFIKKTWRPVLISAFAGMGVLGATLGATWGELPWTIHAVATLGSLVGLVRHLVSRVSATTDGRNGAGYPGIDSGRSAYMTARVPVAISLGILAAHRYWTPEAMAIEAALLHLLAFAEAARPPNMTRVLLALFRRP
ncbi:hypothetical protein ACOTCA_16660 [Achromobacter xylosoxidans]|uniref:hypothetical protein n=1 Tax=Alcaligenes xylosoxydans xylosoxydans TaxID=85698 RepID=UPI001EEAEE3F|nr:hypothetical protein [Achromobacter xylosoxidans]